MLDLICNKARRSRRAPAAGRPLSEHSGPPGIQISLARVDYVLTPEAGPLL
eukprot:SAG31_NODE_25854_length_452_cov_9.923513_1_plen_50_part_10